MAAQSNIKQYNTANGGICAVDVLLLKHFLDNHDFVFPEFEEFTYDYMNFGTPYGLLAPKAEHGQWIGWSVEYDDDAIASEIGVYYDWRSLLATFNEPGYECGISCASIYSETGWGAIPNTVDIAYAQIPIIDGMNHKDNARLAYDALKETLAKLGYAN